MRNGDIITYLPILPWLQITASLPDHVRAAFGTALRHGLDMIRKMRKKYHKAGSPDIVLKGRSL